jgi:hypothetical protein
LGIECYDEGKEDFSYFGDEDAFRLIFEKKKKRMMRSNNSV